MIRLRKRYGVHPHAIAYRSTVGVHDYMRWENGKRELPLGARLLIWITLRQLVAEKAIVLLDELSDVTPYAQRRVEYDIVAAQFRAQRRAVPPPPPMAPVPELEAMRPFLERVA